MLYEVITLVIKRGGHADQLSSHAGLDKYRIQSIIKLLESDILSHDQREAVVAVLQNKCEIYASGCKKRGRLEEMAYYHRLVRQLEEEKPSYNFV